MLLLLLLPVYGCALNLRIITSGVVIAKVTSNEGDCFSNIYALFFNLVVWHGMRQNLNQIFSANPGQIKNCWVSSEVQYSKSGVFRGIHYCSYFSAKHRLWDKTVLESTHNLCVEEK